MLFMVIERFKGRDLAPVYARLRERGRTLPDGLRYVESWIEVNLDRCFQAMEADDVALLQRWILEWRDLAEFEVVPERDEPRERPQREPEQERRQVDQPDRVDGVEGVLAVGGQRVQMLGAVMNGVGQPAVASW